MDFDLNDEQRQLKDSLERLLAANYGDLNKRLSYMKQPKGYSDALWKQYADLGLLAVPFAEEHGGLGQGLTETMIIAEAFGRALAIEPYFATVVLAGGVLRHSGNSAQLTALVPAIVEGKLTLALAHQERQARYDIADTATTARAAGKGGNRLIHHALQHGEPFVRGCQHRLGPDAHRRQRHVGRAHAVLGRIAAARHAAGLAVDEKQADAGAIGATAGNARGHDQLVGAIAG